MILTENNNAWDFDKHHPEMALLPLVCFEPHSDDLPLGTDSILMNAISRGVAERLEETTFLLPAWPYGTSGYLSGQPGVISLDHETLWHVVRDIAVSLNERGIHKVVVLNNHGSAMTGTIKPIGNFITKTAVRQLNYEEPGIQAIWVQPFSAARERLMELFDSAADELHVGAVELSLLMHLVPEKSWPIPEDFVPDMNPSFLQFKPLAHFSPNGVWGKPSQADAQKGATALEAIIDGTVKYIQKTYRQLEKLSEKAA